MCENYDIVHLNWIGNEFLSLKEIIKIKKKLFGQCMMIGLKI